jgi:hypothetical protein
VAKKTARTLRAVNLQEFYGTIELTALQRSYAETTVAEFNSQIAELQKQINELRKETSQSFLNTIGGIAKSGVKESELNRINIKQWYEKLQQRDDITPQQKSELENIFNQHQAKLKPIQQTQRQTKKTYTTALIALLTPVQQKQYLIEHPPATAKDTTQSGIPIKPTSRVRSFSTATARP